MKELSIKFDGDLSELDQELINNIITLIGDDESSITKISFDKGSDSNTDYLPGGVNDYERK